MNVLGKIISSFVTVGFAIIGGIWTAYTVLTGTMDSKDAQAKTEIRSEMYALRAERDARIDGLAEKTVAALNGHQLQLESMDKKLNILIRRK